MFGSGILGVVIGLILVYFLFSTVCSAINEVVEAGMRRRSKYLEAAIADLLGPELKDRFYGSALIRSLRPAKGRPNADMREQGAADDKKVAPSYIPSTAFSNVLLSLVSDASTSLVDAMPAQTAGTPVDLHVASTTAFPPFGHFDVGVGGRTFAVTKAEGAVWTATPAADGDAIDAGATVARVYTAAPSTQDLTRELRAGIEKVPNARLRGELEALLGRGVRSVDEWRRSVETWFDNRMDRVAGWYKRRTKYLLFAIGLILVAALNVDTLQMGTRFWSDQSLRQGVNDAAASVAANRPGACTTPQCIADTLAQVKQFQVPIGWGSGSTPDGAKAWSLKVFGLLVTAFALMLGAPFWFDLLNKFINFRATGLPPPRSSAAAAASSSTS